MKSVTIKLSLAENVKSFVNIVNRYPYDVDLRAGRHVVDAKSIMGIFSLDLSKPITMEIYTDSCDDLLNDIKPFMALCRPPAFGQAKLHSLKWCPKGHLVGAPPLPAAHPTSLFAGLAWKRPERG